MRTPPLSVVDGCAVTAATPLGGPLQAGSRGVAHASMKRRGDGAAKQGHTIVHE